MALFSALYQRVLRGSRHPHAPRYLCALSFAESSFFLIPPDVMLAPMVLARPERAWWLAALTTASSVLGGLFGYLIGDFALQSLLPLIHDWGYGPAYDTALSWFQSWGIWVILAAGFSPIPYKLFTIAAGGLGMALLPFLLCSALGRGGRFFLVAALLHALGPRIEPYLQRYMERIGWGSLAIIGGAVLLWKL